MKVALVHYWLVGMRGGEKVLEELCHLFPQADIYTHVVDPAAISETLRAHTIRTTLISRLPGAVRHYQKYLPLMPLALEELDLRGYDLVISSESGPAKGVITGPETLHICYCHSPMRYLWNMYHEYKAGTGRLTRFAMAPAFHYLRQWDLASAARVDHFMANSTAVQARISKYYRRRASVVHPPVDTEAFTLGSEEPDDFYLVCGQLVGYKRADVAVEAFSRMGKPLVVIGGGEQFDHLRRIAGPTVHLMGHQPFEVLRDHFARCRALIFPGEEDFGIVPVEVMASGRPVIAYGKGGALDTVVNGVTGLLYQNPTVEGLVAAVEEFERRQDAFNPEVIRAHAERFSRTVFREGFTEQLEKVIEARRRDGPYGTEGVQSLRTTPLIHERETDTG